MVAAMERIIDTGGLDGESVDYLDGVVFSADESYLCIGMQTSVPGPVSDYTGQDIYYRSIQHEAGIKEDRLTIHDYFWRWDTDWFWCSRSFGAQNPRLRRWWPRRYRRSSVYWRLMALDQRFGIADRFENSRGRPARERVVQDIEVPIERTCEFLEWFGKTCPFRQSGCARCGYAITPAGRCTRSGLTVAMSTSGSGRRCRLAPPRAPPTARSRTR